MITALLLLTSLKSFAPEEKKTFLHTGERINPYTRILRAVIATESGGDVSAFNKTENAKGCLQIRPIRIRDFNRLTGKNYSHDDAFDYDKAVEVFMYYASHFDYRDERSIARDWNKSTTDKYWNIVKTKL